MRDEEAERLGLTIQDVVLHHMVADVAAGYLITDELARMLYTLHHESG